MEKINIEVKLDEIFKEYNRLDEGQFNALMNQFQYMRECFERYTTEHGRKCIAEKRAEGMGAVISFLCEAAMIKRSQADQLWKMVETIIAENK